MGFGHLGASIGKGIDTDIGSGANLDISDGPGGDGSVVLGWRFGGSMAVDILSDDEIWLAHEFFFKE